MAESVLVLVRHGQSEWNAKNLFTGWKDPDLTHTGVNEAIEAGRKLRAQHVHFDAYYTSELLRAQRTMDLMLSQIIGQTQVEVKRDVALNERDYGDLSGLNKDDARKKWGEDQVHIWRRSFDTPPPGGESLKDTAERTLPYFDREIVPHLKAGRNVLISAHGNSLRSIVMQLDKLSPEEVVKLEIATGTPIVYRIDANGDVIDKKVLD